MAQDFPRSDHETWRKLAARITGHEDPDAQLAGTSADGIEIKPLYARNKDGFPIIGKRGGDPWQIIQRIDHPDPHEANKIALNDLEGGATGLNLVFAGAPSARGFGLKIENLHDLERALNGVTLSAIALRFEAGGSSLGAAALMIALADKQKLALSDLDLSLGLDPIGTFAVKGLFPKDYSKIGARLGDVASALYEREAKAEIVIADGRNWHEAGASEAQELAFILASALAYLRDMEGAGLPLDWAASRIGAVLTMDSDQIFSIAKIRALRLLWAKILAACKLDQTPLNIHTETAWRMMSCLDAHTNMLRTSMAGFAAAIGGADSLCVLPFTSAMGLADDFARSLARNTQTILAEESHLARIVDPAAGSGALEAVTRDLAEKAWGLFQEIEADGGIIAGLQSQKIQKLIAKTRETRTDKINHRREGLTGVNIFPDLTKTQINVLDVAPSKAAPAKTAAIDLPPPGKGEQFNAMIALANEGHSPEALMARGKTTPLKLAPLAAIRLAEPFEILRLAANNHKQQTGAHPRVFLATSGKPSDFSLRAQFAKNIFTAGGIEALGGETYDDAEALTQAFKASACAIAILCSSDDIYAADAAELAKTLKHQGAKYIYVIGQHSDLAAIDLSIGEHDDAIDVLTKTHGFLEIGCS